MTTRERLINEGVIRPRGQKPTVAQLKAAGPQQAHVPKGGEYEPRETVADRKLSGTGEGTKFDDNVSDQY